MLEDKKERQVIQFVATYLWYKNGDGKRKHRHKKKTSVTKSVIRLYSY